MKNLIFIKELRSFLLLWGSQTVSEFSLLDPILSWEREKINGDCQVPYLHTFNMTDPFSHLLSLQRLLNLLFLTFQIILFFIQIITLFAGFFHVLQLRPHSLPAIWLNLFIFSAAYKLSRNNLIVAYFVNLPNAFVTYMLKYEQFPVMETSSTKTYPVYQILHLFDIQV